MIYNGFKDGETRTSTRRARKTDGGHSQVALTTTRLGSAFAFRTTLTCQCGWTASSKSGIGPLVSRHERHRNA